MMARAPPPPPRAGQGRAGQLLVEAPKLGKATPGPGLFMTRAKHEQQVYPQKGEKIPTTQ